MNILIVGPYPPPYGGISSLIRSLVEGLKQKEVNKVVILYFGNKNQIRIVNGAIVHEVSIKKNIWQIFNPLNWLIVPALIKIYNDKNISLKDYFTIFLKTILTNNLAKKYKVNVSSFYQSNTSLHTLLLKQIWDKDIPIILTVFGELYDVPEYLMPKKSLLLEMLHQSDAIISSSCYCADSFKTIGNKSHIEVIYVGVSISRFSNNEHLREDFRKKLAVKDESIVLLFMGRFNKEMGLHGIIEIFPLLLESNIDFHLVLAGASGELVNSAKQLQKRFPERITLMNDILFDLQPSLYAASDLVLAPSRDKHACMGVSIKEAMAAAVPVVASNSGGIPEAVIHNETGIIVPLQQDGENNIEDYKNAILNLASDKEKRKTFSKNSLLRAKELFSEEETLDKTFKVFKKHASS